MVPKRHSIAPSPPALSGGEGALVEWVMNV